MFTLIIEDKHGSIADEYTFEEGEFLIGRSQSADIILPSDNVSRRHARLYTVDGRCYIEDLNSSNGVFVNGRRIHEVFQIQRSAQLKVGDYYLHVEGGDAEVADEDRTYCRLIGQNLSFADQVFRIQRTVTLVGRGKDCSLTLIDPSISRIHSKMTVERSGSLLLEDLKSSNGTFLNDDRIEVATINHRDTIRFGNAEFIVELPDLAPGDGSKPYGGGPPISSEFDESWHGQPPKRRGLWVVVGIVALIVAIGAIMFAIFGGGSGTSEVDAAAAAAKPAEAARAKKAEAAKKAADERAAAAEEKKEEIEELSAQAKKLLADRKWDEALKVWQSIKDLDQFGEVVDAQKKMNRILEWKAHGEVMAKAKKLDGEKRYGEAYKTLLGIDESSPYFNDAKTHRKQLEGYRGPLEMLADELQKLPDCAKLKQALAKYQEVKQLGNAGVVSKIVALEKKIQQKNCK